MRLIGTGFARACGLTAKAGLLAGGLALVAGVNIASAANVDCDGAVSAAGNRDFEYEFTCQAALPGTADKIDAFSLISNKQVGGFDTEVIVYNSSDEVVENEAFGCEGPIPGFGFGCNGGANGSLLGNTPRSAFSLSTNPCSNKEREEKWRMWLVVQSDKINPATNARVPTSSEPFRLSVPKCKPAHRG